MRPAFTMSMALILSLLVAFPSSAQAEGETFVVQLQDFNSQKNLSIHELFKNDQNIEVINSCDILGLVVLRSKQSANSRAEAKAYSQVRLQEVMEREEFEYVTDMSSHQVLTECRAAMQRALTPTDR